MEATPFSQDIAPPRRVISALLNTIAALTKTQRLDELLNHILNQLGQVVPSDAASIGMLRAQQCRIVASCGVEPASFMGFALDQFPLIRHSVQSHQPIIVPDVQEEPDWVSIPELGPVRSWLCVPLLSKGEVIGVLMTSFHAPHVYEQETARLVLAFAQQAALVIEDTRLHERIQTQLREANLLHSVTAALSSTLNAEHILPYVARSLCEILNGTSAHIFTLDRETGEVIVIAEYAISEATEEELRSTLGQTLSLADFPTVAHSLAQRRPLQVQADDAELAPAERQQLARRGIQAALFLPIAVGDRVQGLAQVGESLGTRRFTERECATGQTLIHQAAIAMENASLFEETQQRVRELQLLHDVSLAAASGLRMEDTLQAAAEALATELQGDVHVGLALLAPEGNELCFEAGVGYPADLIGNLRIPLGEGITGWVAQHGRPILVSDVSKEPRYVPIVPGIRSELCVPLSVGPFIMGVLNVESPQINAFTDNEQRLLSTLASNLAVFVERARLFEEIESARIELQQRAEELQEANLRLQELDRLKDQFLANMSHELRTPLNSIIGFSEVLVDGLVGDLSPDQKEFVQDIHASGQHLLTLINDILDLSKIEAGQVVLNPTTFQLADLLTEVRATVAPLIEKKSQTFTIQQAPDLPPITADRIRIKQVLLNLLSNANKFTPDDGEITLDSRLLDPNTLRLSVTDTGVGIKLEDQEIIFEEFRQADGSATREMMGTGLGLAISKRLVEMHGGRIWVESTDQQGSTFILLLPLAGPSSPMPAETGEASKDGGQEV